MEGIIVRSFRYAVYEICSTIDKKRSKEDFNSEKYPIDSIN